MLEFYPLTWQQTELGVALLWTGTVPSVTGLNLSHITCAKPINDCVFVHSRVISVEYKTFSLKVFQDHIYQEVDSQSKHATCIARKKFQ
jgi:hypothetical protein